MPIKYKKGLLEKKFGKPKVVEYVGKKEKGRHLWICKCGYYDNLTKPLPVHKIKTKKSCGCIRRIVDEYPGGFYCMYNTYKKNALKRNREFDLTKEEFYELTQQHCYYCGNLPSQKISSFIHNGIDRVKNDIGYIKSNIVTCCGKCNKFKWSSNQSEFLEHISKISFYQNRIMNKKIDFDDVLIEPILSNIDSRSQVVLDRKFDDLEINAIPIIASNMDFCGTLKIGEVLAKNHNMMTCLHKYYDIDKVVKFMKEKKDITNNIFLSCGINDLDLEKIYEINKQIPIRLLCVDVANGYIRKLRDVVKILRKKLPNTHLMVGNVCTPSGFSDLIKLGIKIIKVGIGPGSQCQTRKVTGVGVPQLSTIIDCVQLAHEHNIYVCGDGGIKTSGDAAKAFAAGVDFIMIGSMFGGCEECDGEWIYDENGHKKYHQIYGMASSEAMKKYNNQQFYRASEGKVSLVDYKGSINDVVQDFLGGLRSTCTYTNSKNLIELRNNANFIRVR